MALSNYDIECINNAKDLISKELSKHYTIEQIATHAGLSATKLKKGFKELYGKGMFTYLEDLRLEQGKEMIENSERTLKQISKLLGYKFTNNFGTAFKKKFSISPGRWRKRYINN